jgi:hypothetical protein
MTVSPPRCPAGESYRTSPRRGCYEQQDYWRTRGYEWTCDAGTRVTASGEHGVSYSCRIALSPPRCPAGESYRTSPAKGCYESETYYDSRPYRYSCPSGYTLRTSGGVRSCTKTETYRKRVCAFDPIAGQQCWWENRTRTLTAAVIASCPSGYSPDGTGCTADTASTRWKRTASTPTRYRYEAAARSCPSGYSDNGSQCRSDTASQRWVRTTSQPVTRLTRPAEPYCDSGYSDSGTQCQSDTASQRWVRTTSQPVTRLTRPAEPYCDSGYSDNGAQCEADTATVTWDRTASVPKAHRYVPAVPRCTTAGFAYSPAAGRCERTVYSDPVEPSTRLVGDAPTVSCAQGYEAVGGGQCSRTVLGGPTRTPVGAECVEGLGALAAGTVSRSGTLEAGCVSLRRGDAQSPHRARRYTLQVAAASTATIAASSAQADVFVYVLSGSGSAVTVIASDDDSGPGTDARAAGVPLAAGVAYTVEVTTSASRAGGAFTLTVSTELDEPPVVIAGLADAAEIGGGTVTASDSFTVEPADAVCTAAAAGVAASVTGTSVAGERVVSVTAAAPFSHIVTVACDAPGRSRVAAEAILAGRLRAVSVTGLDDTVATVTSRGQRYATDRFAVDPPDAACTVSVAGRGAERPWVSQRGSARTLLLGQLSHDGAAIVTVTCTAPGHSPGTASALFSAGPRPRIGTVTAEFAPQDACTATTAAQGVDAAYRCTLAEGATLTATLTATADHAAIAAAWDADSAVTAAARSLPAAAPVVGPDGAATGSWQTTAAADLACTADGAVTATVTAGRHPAADTYTAHVAVDCQTPVRITGLDDTAKIGTGVVTAADEFTVEPADATCTAAAPVAKPAVTDGDTAAKRIASLRMAVPFSRTVTVTCDADGRSPAQAEVKLSGAAAIGTVIVAAGRACAVSPGTADYVCTVPRNGTLAVTATAQGAEQGLSLAWAVAGGAAAASPTQAAVTPMPPSSYSRASTATLSCTAEGMATVTVTAGLATRTVTIEVDCASTAIAVACDDPLGSLAHGTITRSGTITKDAACTSTRRRPRSSDSYFAKRHTFTLDGPATVTVGLGAAASGSERLDTYLILHQGHSAGVNTPLRRDSSRLRNMRLAAGDYTIEATTQQSGKAGGYTLTVNVRYHRTVAISDVTGAVGAGAGPVRVSGTFTVMPPTAHCTATPPTAVVVTPPAAISDPRLGGRRTVSAALSVPGTAQVSVGCTAAGYRPAQKNATLVHAGALQSITARVSGGGQCTTASTRSGADAHFRCMIGRGNTMIVAADVAATGPTVDVAWTATAGVAVHSQSQPAAVPSFPPRSTSPVYQRTATTELGCTANGTATAAATLPGTAARKTVLLTVTCADAVAIVGLVDSTEHGTGTVPVSARFAVSPTSATCGADPSTASVAAGRNGLRTVSASIASPGSLAVTVTCEAAGYADGIRKMTLAAALPCAEHLGGLAAGVTRRSGTVTADRACNSAERHRASRDSRRKGVYHAKRHTFTMPNPGWVTVDLLGAVSDERRFNTYLNLLDGHSPLGDVIGSDNNSGLYSDARLVEVFLEAGRYTIEATTAKPGRTGDYTLTINVDFTPRAETQPTRLSVKKGATIRRSWPYGPAAATVTVAAPDSLGATVSRSTTTGSKGSATLAATPTRIGKFTAKVTYTNGSDSLSKDTKVIVFDGSCPPTGNGGLRARQMHHHDDGHGHAGCDAHQPPVCTSSYSNPWTPDGRRGHLERNLKQCSSKHNIGIIKDPELELLPWSPYDIDRNGNPIVCEHARNMNYRSHTRQAISICMDFYKFKVVTWNSNFDIDVAMREYEAQNRRTIPDLVRSDLERIQQAIDHRQTILVGTQQLPRRTGSKTLDEAFVQIICEGVVDYAADRGVKAASKKVGGWAKNKFPTGTVLRGAAKIGTVLSIAETFAGVFYQNFATDVVCD